MASARDGAQADLRLAIDGGEPVRRKPWREHQTIGKEEIAAALAVLKEGHLSLFVATYTSEPPFSFWGGPRVQALEEAWSRYYAVSYAVAMNSATSGLIAAVGALELGFGDEVIVSPYTMTAAATCMLLYGAIPIFADVKEQTGSLDPASIESHITPRTRAILVVHQFGIPADMDSILAIARRHRLKVMEDCAQAHGAFYRGRPVGTFGDIGVFSLNVHKTIQTGEGGVCVTRDPDLRKRLALIRNHAEVVVRDAGYEKLTNLLGFNFRMTELQAAVAMEQLKKLEALNALRCQLVEALSEALSGHPFLVPPPPCPHAAFGEMKEDGCRSTYYLYPLRFLSGRLGVERDEFAKCLLAEGIPFSQGYAQPLYRMPLFEKKELFKHGYPFTAPENQAIQTNYHAGACPVAERLYEEEMLIGEYVRPPHTREEMMEIVRAIEKVARHLRAQQKVTI